MCFLDISAQYDQEKIAAWRLGLIGILNVFDVCFVVSGRLSLPVRFSTELTMDTHLAVCDARTIVSDVRVMVSDIHCTVVKDREGNDGKNRSAGDT